MAATSRRRRRGILLGGALLALAVAGCATPQTEALLAAPPGMPRQASVDGVPFRPQERYYCGPASLAMALGWSGLAVDQNDIAAQVYTPGREGTLQADMLASARRHGRLAIPVRRLPDLVAELAAGHPVIVFQNLGLDIYPVWHYAVAIGYDLDRAEIVLHSGLEERLALPLGTFERTWRRGGDWALLVLPSGRLAASAGEAAHVEAAIALERVGRPAEAAAAYEAIGARWPTSFGAAIGLGNARFGLGQFEAAAAAFRRATEARPDNAPAWNNLAYSLHRLGRQDEALSAAERAVRLGGADAAAYRRTLEDIRAAAGKNRTG